MQNDRQAPPDLEKSRIPPYYKALLSEEDYKLYIEHFMKELPAAFRACRHNRPVEFQENLEGLIGEYLYERIADKSLLTKLPCGFGYQFSASRVELRNDAALNKAHKFLVVMNEAGYLMRQEFVSMIPPIFLNAQPGEKVLDMCAAPGSKTSQLMEQVGLTGLVVANDLELQRCHVLLHQVVSQPIPQLLLTNLDASKYPRFTEFDRILCDVPCSGDGTLRKAKDLWAKWRPLNALALHDVQLRIALRGLQLLRVGGEMCYSTCSLNPIEDEAVVQTILKLCGSSVEILDCSDRFPGIQRSPGISEWPMDLNEADSGKKDVPETAYPLRDAAISEKLKKTMRFYPWQNNSGGFFVCLLRKVADLPCEADSLLFSIDKNAMSYAKATETAAFCADLSRRLPLHPQRKINNPEIIKAIKEKYALTKFFEEGDAEEILNGAAQREVQDIAATRVYIINKHVQRILYSTEHAFTAFHIVQAGGGGFERHTGVHASGMSYRLESPMSFLLKDTKYTLTVPFDLFKLILKVGLTAGESESLKFSDAGVHEQFLLDFKTTTTAEVPGMFLVQINEQEELSERESRLRAFLNGLAISAWFGSASVGFHVKRKSRNALNCLVDDLDIEEIIVSGETTRKKAYRERRAQRQKDAKDGEGAAADEASEASGVDNAQE